MSNKKQKKQTAEDIITNHLYETLASSIDGYCNYLGIAIYEDLLKDNSFKIWMAKMDEEIDALDAHPYAVIQSLLNRFEKKLALLQKRYNEAYDIDRLKFYNAVNMWKHFLNHISDIEFKVRLKAF